MSDITGQAPTGEPQAGDPISTETASTATAPGEPAEPKTYDAEYVKRLRSEAAASRAKLKAFEDAEKARELAAMSETDRLKAELAEARQFAKTREVEALKLRAATKHGLSDDLLEFLTGDDEKAIGAQAEKLAAKLKAAPALPDAGGRNPSGGAAVTQAVNAEKLLEEQMRRIPSVGRRVVKTA